MAMNPEIKTKWIEALRSGKYQQTHGVLRRGDRYCCLGVLCSLNDDGEWTECSGEVYEFEINSKTNCSILPDPVASEAKLSLDAQGKVATLNDSGKSFLEIANYIEANL